MIYTSFFGNINNIPRKHPLISIARTPRGIPATEISQLIPKSKLTPGGIEYSKQYLDQLKHLDKQWYKDHIPNNSVILTGEVTGYTHRNILMKYLNDIGIKCQEFVNKTKLSVDVVNENPN